MTALRDAIARALQDVPHEMRQASHRPGNVDHWLDANAVHFLADAVLAMPEMRNVLAILQDHKRYNPDYWHPDEEKVSPVIREWVLE